MDTPYARWHAYIPNLRTKNSEIVYLILKLKIHVTHKLNNYIISIGVWETSIKTKRIVASTDATHRYCLDHLNMSKLNFNNI